jgi:hypothetical protein
MYSFAACMPINYRMGILLYISQLFRVVLIGLVLSFGFGAFTFLLLSSGASTMEMVARAKEKASIRLVIQAHDTLICVV